MRTQIIGRNIAYYRKGKGLTQKELATQMGIPANLISHYETNRLRVTADLLYKFAQSLDISADKLIGLSVSSESGKKLSLKIVKRMNQIEKLDLTNQKALLKTIDNYLKGAKEST